MLRLVRFFGETIMSTNPTHQDQQQLDRAQRLLARVRHRQLETARAGDVAASARYAQRAKVIVDASSQLPVDSKLAS